MDGALPGDAEQVVALSVVERSLHDDAAFENVDEALAVLLAVLAIAGVDAVVLDLDGDGFERIALAARVDLEGHGGAGAEGPGEEFVGVGAEVVATGIEWLVGHEGAAVGDEQLSEGIIGEGLDDDFRHSGIRSTVGGSLHGSGPRVGPLTLGPGADTLPSEWPMPRP